MKKTIFFIATLFFLANAKAQDVHFGIKGGLNASSLDNKNSNAETKIGFNAGFLAHIHTSNKFWAFQPELYYSLEGNRPKMIPQGTGNTNLSYLNVPVLVQYMFDNGFRIETGPQIGFLLSAKNKTSNTTTDLKSQFKSTAFSIPLGLGYLTTTGLGFDARYNFGISNIYKANDPKIRSNVFQFDVFYQFSHTK